MESFRNAVYAAIATGTGEASFAIAATDLAFNASHLPAVAHINPAKKVITWASIASRNALKATPPKVSYLAALHRA